MASSHNACRVTKNAGVKIVKMDFSGDDLRAARMAHLAEIKKQYEIRIADTTPIKDIADTIGCSVDVIRRLAVRNNIPVFRTSRPECDNRQLLAISSSDADRIIELFYNQRL